MANWYVNRHTGMDVYPGTEAQPFRTIAHAARVVVTPGDRVLIAAEMYPEPVIVHGSGVTFEGIPDSTARLPMIYTGVGGLRPLDQHHDDDVDGLNGQQNPDIVIDHLQFIGGVPTFQARTGLRWTYRSCEFLGGTTGLNVRSDGVTVQNCYFSYQDREAIVGFGADDLTVKNCVIELVNTRGAHDPAGSAVTKFGYTQRLLLEGNTVRDCLGPGLWLDYENTHAIVRGNTVLRARHRDQGKEWQGSGIWVELNRGPIVVEENLVEDCYIGIGVLESLQTTLRGNIIRNAHRAIDLRMLNRGDPMWTIAGAQIIGNTFQRCQEGIVAGEGIWTGFDRASIMIDENTYEEAQGPIIRWLGTNPATRVSACTQLGFECTSETPTDPPPVIIPYVYLLIDAAAPRVVATLDRTRLAGLLETQWAHMPKSWRDAIALVLAETLSQEDVVLAASADGWILDTTNADGLILHVTALR